MVMNNLTRDQQMAYNAVVIKREPNVLITGAGGVGKSYLIHKIVSDMTANNLTVLVGASTNQSATELGGSTAHHIFHIPIHFAWKSVSKDISLSDDDPLLNADVVIIDEISMIRIDAFDYMANIIRYIRKKRPVRPFQLIVVGDFAQLPPVVSDDSTHGESELSMLKKHYGKAYHDGYAFECPAWKAMGFTVYELLEVIRQKDVAMAAALQQIRFGDLSGLEYFKKNSAKKPFSSKTAVTLCGKNRTAQAINAEAIRKLPGKQYTFFAKESGEVTQADRFAAPKLYLKKGCRVIMLITTPQYAKGSTGIITDIESDSYIDVCLDNGITVQVQPYSMQIQKYVTTGKGEDKKVSLETVGTYTQLPITPAYAVTIHRSQGQTYDKANIMIGATLGGSNSGRSEIFAVGQLYVALSRVRTISGIYIDGDLDKVQVLASSSVCNFYKNIRRKNTDTNSESSHEKSVSKPKSAKKAVEVKKILTPTEKDASTNVAEVSITCPPQSLSTVYIYAKALSPVARKTASGEIIVPQEWANAVKKFAANFG